METLALLSSSSSNKSYQSRSISSIIPSGASIPPIVSHNPLTNSLPKSQFHESKRQLHLTRRQYWIAASLVYAQFWIAACVSLQAPFFPKEAEMKGVTPTEYGLTFGVYELTILVMSPFFGRLVTKYSPVLICEFGFLFCGLCTMTFGWIDRFDDPRLFIYSSYMIRTIEGISAAALLTSSYTIMADQFPDNVATAFAYLEASFGFGLIVGPTVGGALYEFAGFRFPFLVLGGFLCFGFILIKLILGNQPETHSETGEKCQVSFFRFLLSPTILYDSFAIISALFFIGFNCATLEPHLRQFK